MNGYVALYNGKKVEVMADTLYQAKEKAIAEFQAKAGRRKVKSHMVSVMLAEKNGEQVVHNFS